MMQGMLAMTALLAALVFTPFAALSDPLSQAWVGRRRPKWGLGKIRATLRFLGAEDGKVAVAPSKAEELREQAAAKYKEANQAVEDWATENKKTMDDIKADDSILPPEVLATFDATLVDAKTLRDQYEVAAKSEGRWVGLRESMDFFHGKATGKTVPWQQVRQAEPVKTLGQRFVESDTYGVLMESGVLHSDGAKFMTERITEMGPLAEIASLYEKAQSGDREAQGELVQLRKATSDIIHSGSGNEGDALILDQFLPGILQLPQRPLAIRELFASGRATSDTVSYAAQVDFDSGADTVAQATSGSDGAKPQSSLSWERRTRPVETIATYMAATRQQLADAPQTESLIDNQGRLMLQLEEETQLLSGSGASPDLQGVLAETGVQTYDVLNGATEDLGHLNNLKAIRTAKRMTRTGTARMTANAIVLHPNDSEEYDLSTDGNGLFRGGNPVGNFTFNQGLWGLKRVESEAVSEGTALVGAFGAATVLERMPITVYTTDSHSDWFTRNLIAVLFEERLGFPIFYPAAFVNMTLAGWQGGS